MVAITNKIYYKKKLFNTLDGKIKNRIDFAKIENVSPILNKKEKKCLHMSKHHTRKTN